MAFTNDQKEKIEAALKLLRSSGLGMLQLRAFAEAAEIVVLAREMDTRTKKEEMEEALGLADTFEQAAYEDNDTSDIFNYVREWLPLLVGVQS